MTASMSDTSRERLPNRRESEVETFEHDGFRYVAGMSRYADGRPAEVFLNVSAKGGTPLDTVARDAAIVASIALQHGASVDTIRHALTRNADGSASGPLGAILDRIAAGR